MNFFHACSAQLLSGKGMSNFQYLGAVPAAHCKSLSIKQIGIWPMTGCRMRPEMFPLSNKPICTVTVLAASFPIVRAQPADK
jgi:hypothetical protein